MVASASPLTFLAHDQWSPRFENHFFTFRITSAASRTSPPSSVIPAAPTSSPSRLGRNARAGRSAARSSTSVPGNTNHPAYYYEIEISIGHDRRIVYRRYSQFEWLHRQLSALRVPSSSRHHGVLPDGLVPPAMPPRSCFCHVQNDRFARIRMGQLEDFLEDALRRPDAASQECMSAFLELP